MSYTDTTHDKSNIESDKQILFSDTFTRFFAILLALLLVYSVVMLSLKQSAGDSVPGGNSQLNNPSTTFLPNTNSVIGSQPYDPAISDVNSFGEVTVSSGDKNNNNSEPQGAAVPGNSNKMPATADEIVAYYKAANEKAKANAVSVTHLYDNATNYEGIVEAGSLSALGTWAMNTFMKENSEEVVYSSREDIINNFPVGGIEKCNLTADMVDMSKTKCVDNGKEYEITITVNSNDENPDVNPSRGGGKAGTIGSVLTMEQITDPVKGKLTLTGVECRYSAASVTAKIDKATGNLLFVATDLPMILYIENAKAGLISVSGARIGLEFTEQWSVQW